MPCPGEGPCTVWPLDLSCCLVSGGFADPCLGDGTPVPQVIVDQMILAASQFMWRRTGMQFGCCQVTIRPTQNPNNCDCNDDNWFGYPWMPVKLSSGEWTNVSCFCGQDPCGCPAEPCQIFLPYPVCSIDEVKVDGQIIGKSLYRVDDFRKLVLTPGVHDVRQQMCPATGPIGAKTAGDVTVLGPGVDVFTDGSGCGVTFPTVPAAYTINFASPKTDLVFKFHVPPGQIGSMDFFVAGGDWSVESGDGHFFPPGVQKTPSGQGVTWTNPSDGGTGADFFITVHDSGNFGQIITNYTSGLSSPDNLRLEEVSWTAPGAGMDCWPKCNNLGLSDDEVGTMSVKLTYGRPIPELVLLGAQELACNLIKGCVGKPCDLPRRVQSISRQGMNATFLDPMEFMKDGFTGIYLVDLAIRTYNPHGLYKKAAVYSPDSINKWTVTTWENKSGGREDPIGPGCTNDIEA